MALIKQKLAFKKVLKGTPISHAMKEVGYAPSTAKTTTKLTASKGWQELVAKHIPENKLALVHARGLDAFKVMFSPEGEMIQTHDFPSQHKFMETGYKLHGKLRDTDTGNKTLVVVVAGESAIRYGISQQPEGSST